MRIDRDFSVLLIDTICFGIGKILQAFVPNTYFMFALFCYTGVHFKAKCTLVTNPYIDSFAVL